MERVEYEGPRIIDAPKADEDAASLVTIAWVEISERRVTDLARIEKEFAVAARALLREGMDHLVRLGIVPTVEFTIVNPKGEKQKVREKAVPVATIPHHDKYATDIFVNTQGQLLSCLRYRERTISIEPAHDGYYLDFTRAALLETERTVQAAATTRPKLRMVENSS